MQTLAVHGQVLQDEARNEPGGNETVEQAPAPAIEVFSAAAPVRVARDNDSISGVYLCDMSGRRKKPIVNMTSTKGDITAAICLNVIFRRCFVSVSSTTGHIAIALPRELRNNKLSIEIASTNGNVFLALPRDFYGTLNMKTTSGIGNGRIRLLKTIIQL
ncbi:hypothetical protein EMMF5_002937 [Cystobasidiomycetes sp. EMM_F5]